MFTAPITGASALQSPTEMRTQRAGSAWSFAARDECAESVGYPSAYPTGTRPMVESRRAVQLHP